LYVTIDVDTGSVASLYFAIVKGIASYRKGILIASVFVTVLVILGVMIASLDAYREIKKLRHGSIWHIPSKVYSAPLILTPGTDIGRIGLMDRFHRLRYREVKKVSRPGEFSRDGKGLTVFIHSFSYMGEQHGAMKVRLLLEGRRISDIVRPGTKDPVGRAMLEPECIAEIFDDLYEDRTIVRLDECPKYLIDAVITTEDRRFYRHRGIDVRSLARAGFANLRHGGITEGGSTITQQLVKNLFLTHKRTFSRKIRDMWLAVVMETMYSKDQILEMYINEIYMGSYSHAGVCGLARASKVLFDKSISDINLSEAALLAGLIKAPNAYSPYTNKPKALARRNTVLSIMLHEGKITPEQYRKAKRRPLAVVDLVPRRRQAPYFIDHVLSLIRGQFSETILEKGGYQIYTTLDMNMQITAESCLSRGLKGKDGSVDGAVVIMDPASGEILAMVGGKGYAGSQFNRATKIRRHIGSLIKPIVYYTALKNGYTLTAYLDDTPISITTRDGTVWTPMNYDRTPHGRVMLKDALANSYNLATVRLGMELEVSNVLLELGKVLPFNVNSTNPSVLLGAVDCSPVEVSTLFSAFANGGNRVTPSSVRAVIDDEGVVVMKFPETPPTSALDPATVYLLNAALQEVVTSGTARESLAYGMPGGICGKTGTTDDARDSWFVGFSPRMVVTVWLGADKFRPIGYSGAAGAMPIASTILSRLSPSVSWPVPQDITVCTIDPANGKLANTWTSQGINVPYLRGTEPTEVSDAGPSFLIPDIPRVWNYFKSWIWKPSE